jgi:hypothetical protein
MHLLTLHCLREFLASKQITVLEHPPYLPGLAPSIIVNFIEDVGVCAGSNPQAGF